MAAKYQIAESNVRKYLVSSSNEQQYQIARSDASEYLVSINDLNIIHVGSSREYTSLYDAVLDSTDGTLIIIDEGEYLEEAQIEIPIGVSLVGSGEVIIKTNYEADDPEDAFLLLESPLTGEDGSQEISNIIFDGEFNGCICALVWCRSNVIFQNCTIKNFTNQGIQYKTKTWWSEPTYYATGNIVRNCVFRDCSRRTAYGQGAIWCHGQGGFLVHDNTFYLEDMPAGQNGNMMMVVWVKAFKYYNNASWKSLDEGVEYNMGIELWDSRGGNEIYNNVFNGGGTSVDIAGISNTKGDYDYSWWIHNNEFLKAVQGATTEGNSHAVSFEAVNSDAIVSYNRIVNIGKAFTVVQAPEIGQTTTNISFYYNIMENIGYTDNPYGAMLTFENQHTDDIIENIFIYNNTFKGLNANSGIRAAVYGIVRNLYIYNNIIEGIRLYAVSGAYFGWLNFENFAPPHLPVDISNIYIRNNIIYDNVNANAIYYWPGVVVTNLVETDNLNSDPKYVSPYTDFHLQEGSPAIDAGINVDIDVDLDGVAVGDPPDIGVYEYVS